MLGFIRSGAIAGVASTLVFTIIHQIFIANIWFSFLFIALAGIVCGISIS